MSKLLKIFTLSEKEFDLFLAEIGVLTSSQQQIFKYIVKYKKDVISYKAFVEKYSGNFKNLKSDLDFLFKKLFEYKRGLIVSGIGEDGIVMPYKIVITEENSFDFYFFYLEDLFVKTYFISFQAEQKPLTIKSSDPKVVYILDSLHELKREDINLDFFQSKLNERILYVWNSLIIPSSKLLNFINFTKEIFFIVAENSIVKNLIIKAKDIKIVDYNKRMNDAKEDMSLLYVDLKTILELKEEIESKKQAVILKDYFLFLEFLLILLENIRNIDLAKKQREAKLREFILEVERELSNIFKTFSIADYKNIIKEKNSMFNFEIEEIENNLNSYFLLKGDRDEVPKIFNIKENLYLYKENAYEVFLKEISFAGIEIRKHLIKQIRFMLRHGYTSNAKNILNESILESEIKDFIDEKFSISKYLFNNRNVLIDIIISYAKKVNRVKIREIVKEELEKYINTKTNDYLYFRTIYNINLEDVYSRAFNSLSYIRKFILYLTGKYQVYKENFQKLDKKAKVNITPVKKSSKMFVSSSVNEQKDDIKREEKSSRFNKVKYEPIKKTPRILSREQVERAWGDFESSLYKFKKEQIDKYNKK